MTVSALRIQHHDPLGDIAPRRWLLLRGLGRERGHWFGFDQLLSEALGAPCEPVDLPGVGEARFEKAPTNVARTAEIVAARAERRIAKEAGRVGILGLSLGGMVALELCRLQPEWFSHLVVLNTSSRLSPPWLRLQPAGVALLVESLLERDDLERERSIYELTLNLRREHAVEYAAVAARFRARRPTTRSAILRQLRAAATFAPGDIAQPALVLSSKQDRLVSSSCSTDLATFLGAVHVEHEFAGHDLPLEAPEWIAEQLRRWLASSDAVPAS